MKFYLAECKFMVYITWNYITAWSIIYNAIFKNNENDLGYKSIICKQTSTVSFQDSTNCGITRVCFEDCWIMIIRLKFNKAWRTKQIEYSVNLLLGGGKKRIVKLGS